MHLVYRAFWKLEYARKYPSSHLRMYYLVCDRVAFGATFGGLVSLTSAGSFRAATMIENTARILSIVYRSRIEFVCDRNKLYILPRFLPGLLETLYVWVPNLRG